MKKLILSLMLTILAIGSTQARAQDASSTPKTKTLTAKITNLSLPSPVPGECVGAGFASQCPSGNCQCFTSTGATVKGTLAGKGTADASVTEDLGTLVPTTGNPHQCNPEYANVVLTTTLKKIPLTETISAILVSCHEIKTGGKPSVTGGFGIESATNGAIGFGTATGSVDQTTGVVSLTLKGEITQ